MATKILRVKPRRFQIGASYFRALMLIFVALNGGTATASPRWERTDAAGLAQGVAIAICLSTYEVICIGIGCRDPYGFDFVEMIVGDWLQGPTRLSAGAHSATSVMSVDEGASRALNLPVSRGPIERAFLLRLVGQRTLRIEAFRSGYVARFPLAGFGRARRMLLHICRGRHPR